MEQGADSPFGELDNRTGIFSSKIRSERQQWSAALAVVSVPDVNGGRPSGPALSSGPKSHRSVVDFC
jgi:hypothetical protein